MWCLFLTTVLPRAGGTGGEIVSQSVVEAIRRTGMEVRVLGYQRSGDVRPEDPEEVSVGRRPIETSEAGARAVLWMLVALGRGMPYSQAKYRTRRLLRAVAQQVSEGPALVLLDHAQVAFAVDAIPLVPPMVLVAHNVETNGYAELAASSPTRVARWVHGREARLIGQAEERLARRCHQIWALTDDDASHFAGLSGAGEVTTLPVASRLAPSSWHGSDRCDVALIGSWGWRANARGLRWFADEVVPRLPSTVRIEVAGHGADWLRERYPNVTVRGRVDDAQRFLERARVIAVPSRAGSGVQIKTLDAIASGATVVATSVAVRGLGRLPRSVSVAADASAFAAALDLHLRRPGTPRPDPDAVAWSRDRAQRFDRSIAERIGELVAAAAHRSPALGDPARGNGQTG